MVYVLIGIVFTVFLLKIFLLMKHPKGPGQANQDAHNLQALSSPLAGTYTCGYSNIGFCTLIVDTNGVKCEQAGQTLFQLAITDIVEVNTSYWAIQFVTSTEKYSITSLHKPEANQLVGAATRSAIATEPSTLKEFEQILSAHNVRFKRKLTLQKHMVVALVGGVLSLLFLGYLVFMSIQ